MSFRGQYLFFLVVLGLSITFAEFYDELTENSLIDLAIRRIDKNKDGKITLEDVQEEMDRTYIPIENIIRKLDNDNDNDIDQKDLQILIKDYAYIVVSMIDLDKDGYVSEEEFNYSFNATSIMSMEMGLVFMFNLLDLNEDGVISDSDFPKMAPFQKMKILSMKDKSSPVSLLYKSINSNEDYEISKTELTQFYRDIFNKIDTNKDGITTSKEILQAMNIYKFPKSVINITEVQLHHMYNASRKTVQATFSKYDTNKDDKMDAIEISSIFTKPMSRTFIITIKDIYTSLQLSPNVKSFKTFDLPASYVSVLTFLEIQVPSPVDMLIKKFARIDKNSDEKITQEELDAKVDENEHLFKHFDSNKDGSIDHTDIEFLAQDFAVEFIGIFDIFWKNGYITKNEVSYSMNEGASSTKGWEGFLLFLFYLADVTEDGIISDTDLLDIVGSRYRTSSQSLKSFLLREKHSPVSKVISILLKAMNMEDGENYQLSRTELMQFLRKIANKLDNNNDGDITLHEILQTMKVFKFPGKLIKRVEQQYKDILKVVNKVWEVIFDEFDANRDDQVDQKELSTGFTKPITSSLVNGVQKIYEILPSSPKYAKKISYKEIENALSSTSNFLQF